MLPSPALKKPMMPVTVFVLSAVVSNFANQMTLLMVVMVVLDPQFRRMSRTGIAVLAVGVALGPPPRTSGRIPVGQGGLQGSWSA